MTTSDTDFNSTGRKPRRGRDAFKKYTIFIVFITSFLNLFPQKVLVSLWPLFSGIPGVLGVGLRYCLFKVLAKHCGENIYLGRNILIKHFHNLSVGNNVSIHENCHINAVGNITIGDSVSIAHQSSILSVNHTWTDETMPIRDQPVLLDPVVIKSDVWVGCGCRILAGVTIESRTVVAAGAVVTKDVSSNTLVGGVPARKLRSI